MKLYDLSYDELSDYLQSIGQKPFRAQQVVQWCTKGAAIEEMTNLPQSLRQTLAQMGTGGVRIAECHTARDGSEKYLYVCEDGHAVEGVLMQYRYGGSLCVSTQAGCRMGCAFCASGVKGLVRNLTAGEMLGQLYAVIRHHGGERPFNHFVLMGCGEPLDNYDHVVKFLHLASQEKGLNLSLRNVSLSTCGLVPQIDRLAAEGLPITLCISLHASDDETRRQIMPIARKYTVDEVVAAARRYERATARRVVFEYILIRGVNDTPEAARKLARLTAHMRKHINLIPLNGDLQGLQAPSPKAVERFYTILNEMGASVTVRRTLGSDVQGACGQLRLRRMTDTMGENA